MDHFQRLIKNSIAIQNNTALAEFEGYSPNEMQLIFHTPFEAQSPIQILTASDEIYSQIPILNLAKYLLQKINILGELKLTDKGNLSTKLVAELYEQGFIKEEMIENGLIKLYKESDSRSIHITKMLLQISPLVKLRKNSLSLTKQGTESLNNNAEIFKVLFETYTMKYNWAYNDHYENEEIGQRGFGFSLILLSKYGQQYQNREFYAAKYLKAFNFNLNMEDAEFKQLANRVYNARTFKRFMSYFGLINCENNDHKGRVKVTEVFSSIIKILPHRKL